MARRRKDPAEETTKETVKFQPLTENQYLLSEAIRNNTIILTEGIAGAGKTHVACCLGVEHLLQNKVQKIVLSRAIVPTENLGFLPGDIESKTQFYIAPILNELSYFVNVKTLIAQERIVISPIAFLQGVTIKNSYVLVDESQNINLPQLRLILSRLGENSKMVFTADLSSIWLTGQPSGFKFCMDRLEGLEGVAVVKFNKSDCIRHPLIQRILERLE